MKPLPFPLRVAAGLAVTTAERVRDLPRQLIGLPVTVASQVLQASMRVQQQITELAIKGDDALAALRSVEETPSWATFDEDLDDLAPSDDDAQRGPSSGATRPDSGTAPGAGPVAEGGAGEKGEKGEKGEEGTVPGATSPADATLEETAKEAAALDAEVPLPRVEDEAHDHLGNNGHRHETPVVEAPEPPDLPVDPWADEERALAEEHRDGEFDSAERNTTDPAVARGQRGDTPGEHADAAGKHSGASGKRAHASGQHGDAAGEHGDASGQHDVGEVVGPAGLPNYDELSLPQVRARLRRFSLDQLEELLAHERAHLNRPSFVGMLSRRINNVRRAAEDPNAQ
ncbi:hypothetical protein SAMN05421810_102365 [Amycolatopsis arida]|uniref:DUF8129 domain-containing protein n=1 Tax=Amycolatopsis arida TaxID=587909 RepID=A0A1I5PR27_9PSEU|nr:lipid droplet-associated protein [Amycolatopsis arida]TDX98572.1 hypothetical protein CLV69_101365 [Amycolatopsis arida]SFP36290.1 hypothetical protein SAMN05421810_102365 [Amycolatopsis arida]